MSEDGNARGIMEKNGRTRYGADGAAAASAVGRSPRHGRRCLTGRLRRGAGLQAAEDGNARRLGRNHCGCARPDEPRDDRAGQDIEWWNVFNDPKLTALVTEALKVNLNVRAAESALRQARAARGVTAAGFWPGVNATGSYTRSKPPRRRPRRRSVQAGWTPRGSWISSAASAATSSLRMRALWPPWRTARRPDQRRRGSGAGLRGPSGFPGAHPDRPG